MATYEQLRTLASFTYSGVPPANALSGETSKVNEEDYEINPLLLNILHAKNFAGDSDTDDPYAHIDFFEQICGTFKLKAFTNDEIKFKLFGQTLSNKAYSWFRALPAGTIWNLEGIVKGVLVSLLPKKQV